MGASTPTLCLALIAAALVLPVRAASSAELTEALLPLEDCRVHFNGDRTGGLVDWQSMVGVEQCDRMKRLYRLSEIASLGERPRFYDGSVAARRLPPDVGISLPLVRVVFPDRVFFDTDSAQLRPEARVVVQIIASSLRLEPPDVAMFVAGHADARGSREYNQRLSIDRANAVAEEIMRQGVNVASVWRVGFGEDMPLVFGEDDDAYGQNRRVEFIFAARPEAVAAWLADSQIDLLCQGRTRFETQTCKARLDLRDDYVALEVKVPPPPVVAPRQRKRTVSAQADSSTISVKSEPVVVTPTPTRKIRIDPINRRGGPILTE